MVKFLKEQDVEKFVCAAGIVSHYVGDASQPLHLFKYYDGRPNNPQEKGVHSTYETNMIERFAGEILQVLMIN